MEQQSSEGPDCPPPPAQANATQPGGNVSSQQNAAAAVPAVVPAAAPAAAPPAAAPHSSKHHLTTELCGNICICSCPSQVTVGATVMLRKNVRTDDGLVNVACGTMTGFRWSQGNSSTAQMDGIEVKFDIEDVGKQGRLHGDEGTEPSSTQWSPLLLTQ